MADTLYVHDFPGGTLNSEEGFQVYCWAKEVMKGGGFNLHKRRANDKDLQLRINEAEGTRSSNESGELRKWPIKVLGLSWDTCEVYFCFEFEELVKFVKSLPATKRLLI